MEEIWKEIEEFPNYHISNFGNVKNVITNKVLRNVLKGGYYEVGIVNNKCRKNFKIHRLVALAFIDNNENKAEVNHKDKNKLNNHIDNLEWMTRTENNQHRCNGLVIKSNKNKQIYRLDKNNGNILEKYNSIEDAGKWALENKLTKTIHNGRNSIGNCLSGLSNSAYGFEWKYVENNDFENEEWREINLDNLFSEKHEWDKKYFVSNLGRFKNSSGTIMDNYKVNSNGYIRVYIYKKTFGLHRLIALTFLENPENKEQVNHIDGNKLNNKLENLEFVTNKENQIHKFQNGLGNNFTRGVKQYDLNGQFIKEYKSIAEAAKEMNVCKSTISGGLVNYRKTAAGFIWKYADDENNGIIEKITINKNRGRKVGQYDMNMKLLNTYSCAADAGRKVNIHKNHIGAVLRKLRKTAGGFIWKYLD